MFNLNHLPELIVHHILGYNIKPYGSFKKHLPYLAICHIWRNVALPLVYKVVFFSPCYRQNSQAIWNSNIDLFLFTGYFHLAKELDISHRSLREDKSAKELGELLNAMNMEPLEWPADGQQKLAPLGVPSRENIDPPLLLNDDMLSMMNRAVSKFIRTFPKINDMGLELGNPDGVFRQLNSQLINTLAGGLGQLRASKLYGEDLTQISQNLTSLTYRCNARSFLVLPKVNSLPLTKLYLSELPMDFSWDLFHHGSGSNDTVIFPNLKDLILEFGVARHARQSLVYVRGLNTATPIRQTNVQFPKLQHLRYCNYQGSFALQPEVISPHLDSLHLEVDNKRFEECGELSISSIGTLDLKFVGNYSDSIEFHRAASLLFSKVEITEMCSVDLSSILYLDTRIVCWRNITNLTLHTLDLYQLVEIICNMPQMETLVFQELEYEELTDDLISHLLLNESRLEEIEVKVYTYSDHNNDMPIRHLVNVLLSLKCLQEVQLGKGEVEKVREMIKPLASLYPRLSKLNIIS